MCARAAYESTTYACPSGGKVYLIWDTYFCASFLGSLCTELVRDGYAKVFEVLSAGLSAGVHEVLSAYAGLPHLHLTPAFAAPLKAGDV